MALSERAAVGLEEERNKADQVMNLLMKDEGVRQIISKKISELYFFSASSQILSTSLPKMVTYFGRFSFDFHFVNACFSIYLTNEK